MGWPSWGLIGPSWGCKGSSLGLTGFSQGPRGSIQEPSGPTYTLSGLRWGLEWLIQGLVLTKQGHGAADCVDPFDHMVKNVEQKDEDCKGDSMTVGTTLLTKPLTYLNI